MKHDGTVAGSRESEISHLYSLTGTSLCELAVALEELEKRLSPVLRSLEPEPAPPQGIAEPPSILDGAHYSTKLGSEIYDLLTRSNMATKNVRRMLNLLAI